MTEVIEGDIYDLLFVISIIVIAIVILGAMLIRRWRNNHPRNMYDNEFITEVHGSKNIAYIWLVMEFQTTQDRERRYNPTVYMNIMVRAICSNPKRANIYKELLEEAHRRKHLPEDRYLKYSVEKIWVDHLLGSSMEGERL